MTTKQPSTQDVMTGLGSVHDRLSALAAAIKELVIAECLTTTTLQFGGGGYVEYDYPGGFASLAVLNTSTMLVTVSASTPQDVAPLTGVGVGLCPPSKGTVHNISAHSVTLYGNPGDRVTLSVFSRPQPPAYG